MQKTPGKFYSPISVAFAEAMDEARLNQGELGSLVGTSQTTITRLRNGEIKLDYDWAKRLSPHIGVDLVAKFFTASKEELAGYGASAPSTDPPPAAPLPQVGIWPAPIGGERDLPVLGRVVGGDDDCFEFNGEAMAWLFRPPTLQGAPKGYAMFVSGTSMEPRYMEGETVFVNPALPVRQGDFVVALLHPQADGANARGLVKQFAGRSVGRILLKSLNPPGAKLIDLPAEQVISLHKIVGTA